MYQTGILQDQCLQISLHNDSNECNVLTNEYDFQATMHLTICSYHRLHNSNANRKTSFIDIYIYKEQPTEYDGTTTDISTDECNSETNTIYTNAQTLKPKI